MCFFLVSKVEHPLYVEQLISSEVYCSQKFDLAAYVLMATVIGISKLFTIPKVIRYDMQFKRHFIDENPMLYIVYVFNLE